MQGYLEFEKPVAELQGKIDELQKIGDAGDAVGIEDELDRLRTRADDALADIYSNLSAWQKTQIARHPARPHFLDYVHDLVTEWTPLAGDRKFKEDQAVLAGFGRIDGRAVAIIGLEKGNDTETRIRHNFGSARPEGYRKAVRIMDMADRFGLPLVTFVDTAGAYPGVGAEERGQAEAIARSTEKCLEIGVPSLSIIIGEGGSGGAIAIATANRVIMLQHAIYSVISPEAGASILFRDAGRAQDMAAAQKITAQDLMELKVIDSIITEPVGGAHRHREAVLKSTRVEINKFLDDFASMSRDEVIQHRADKFLAIGRTLS